ncbi:MAG: potassium channel family protein [Chitinivibrionales bacterium]
MSKKRKHICIVGLGFFGAGLARSLTKNADVLAIDNDITRVNAITDDVQRALSVDVRDFQSLSSVVSDKFDEAIISIGEELESSILCTLYLKRIGIPTIRAKASSEEHGEILSSIGATHVFFPELETAERLSLRIIEPNLLDFVPLAQGYVVVDIAAPEQFYNSTLEVLHLRNIYGILIIAIKKDTDSGFIFLPGPDYTIQAGDILVVIGKEDEIDRLRKETKE